VGQKPVVRTLRNSLARNRVAHAILFSGVRGVGKTTLARIMAKAINCQTDDLGKRPCNQCPSCREIASGSALDLYEIDGASNRGIQEIRELKEKIRFLPTNSPYKIIIIDEVHMLTTEAFNALLKTLEEPPAHIHFMFATTEIHKIPITILSRCQQYELKRIPAGELHDHFLTLVEKEGYKIDQGALSLIVKEAGGSVRDGLSLLDQMFSFGEKHITSQDVVDVLGLVNREILINLTTGLIEGKPEPVLNGLQDIFNYGVDIRRFLDDLMEYFRNILFCKIEGCSSLIDIPEEELKELQSLAQNYSSETVHQKLSLLMRAAEEVRYSLHPRLTLETTFLGIIEAGNVVAVSTLLEHINKLMVAGPAPKKKVPTTETDTTVPPSDPGKDITASPKHSKDTGITDVKINKPVPQKKDVLKHWTEFIQFVKERKIWMAKDLQRAGAMQEDNSGPGELHLTYDDRADCTLLLSKENNRLLTEYTREFFGQTVKIKFIFPEDSDQTGGEQTESPSKIKKQLANDPLVIMATEIFIGQVGDIRIQAKSYENDIAESAENQKTDASISTPLT